MDIHVIFKFIHKAAAGIEIVGETSGELLAVSSITSVAEPSV